MRRVARAGGLVAWAALAPAFVALVSGAPPAWAAPLEFDVTLGACIDTPKAEIERLLRLEIDALGARAGRALTDVRVAAAVACEGGVVLRVTDPLTETALERPLRVTRAAPEARARLVALAIVELLVTSWTDLERRPAREAAPATPASPEARQAAGAIAATHRGDDPPGVRLYALGGGHKGPAAFGVMPELGLRLEAGRGLGAALDARVGRADAEATVGRVTMESLSLTPALNLRRAWGRVGVRGAAGARVAYLRLAGTPADPERYDGEAFSAAWLGPVVAGGVEVTPFARLLVALTLEAGWVARPLGARVVGARELAVEGTWVAANLGCGWAL